MASGVGGKVQLSLVSRVEVEVPRFGLPRPGGQVDLPVSAPGRESLEFREEEAGQAAAAVRGVGPDPLELGCVRPVPAERPAGDG